MRTERLIQIGWGLLPVGIALAFTTIVLIAVNAPPGDAFGAILQGAFGDIAGQGILNPKTAAVLTFWAPLLLCASGLLLTFTAGLWNIGIEGQMMMGAVFASFVALNLAASFTPTDQVLIVRATEARRLDTEEDFRGFPVGVLPGTGPLRDYDLLSDAVEYETLDDAIGALLAGDVRGVLASQSEAEALIADNPDIALGLDGETLRKVSEMPQVPLMMLELAAAALGGALWGALSGVLRTHGNVHEIFSGVALNSLASIFANYLIAGPWQPPEGGSLHSTEPFRRVALMPNIVLPDGTTLDVSLVALVMAVIAFGLVFFALRGTFWGLQLKAMGKSERSAFLLGVPTKKQALLAMTFAGALAGLGGSIRVLSVYGSLRPGVSGGIGFLALLVVLLAAVQAPWVPLIAFFFAAIKSGSTRLQITMQLHDSLGGILQGALVLSFILVNGLRARLKLRR